MRNRTLVSILILVVTLLNPVASRADVKLPAVFAEHMVLQQQVACPVWGWADANEKVTVSIADQKHEATADAGGKWRVKLSPLPAGGPHELTVAGANGTLSVKDVLVGEVWVCSGQSNMEWSINAGSASEEEKSSANYPALRMFGVQKAVTGKPAADVKGQWQVAAPGQIGGWSAVGYFFGKELHKQLGGNVPVGMIHTSWGGTPAEAWTQIQYLENDADLKPIVERGRQQIAEFPKRIEEWQRAANEADAAGQPIPPMPQDFRGNPWRPAGLYNAMLAPLMPYGIKGAIWYQGESNAGRASQYRKLLPAMIKSWRDNWGQGEFPFGVVQLANFMQTKSDPGESEWAELREAQRLTAQQPNNGLCVAIDIGDANDIHPRNKEDVGKRLAFWALSKHYGKDIPGSGPTFASLAVEGDKARVTFTDAHGGLVAKGGDAVKGFAIAGEDRKWYWAEGKIEGDAVVLTSAEVSKPVAVRYAWADNPVCNLFNKAGLPASPFRTDDWKGVTDQRR